MIDPTRFTTPEPAAAELTAAADAAGPLIDFAAIAASIRPALLHAAATATDRRTELLADALAAVLTSGMLAAVLAHVDTHDGGDLSPAQRDALATFYDQLDVAAAKAGKR